VTEAQSDIAARYTAGASDLEALHNGALLADIGAAHVEEPTGVTASDIDRLDARANPQVDHAVVDHEILGVVDRPRSSGSCTAPSTNSSTVSNAIGRPMGRDLSAEIRTAESPLSGVVSKGVARWRRWRGVVKGCPDSLWRTSDAVWPSSETGVEPAST